MDKKSKKLSTKVHTDSFTGKNDSPTSPTDKRSTLKKLVVSSTIVAGSGMLVPTKWASPVVQSIVLPAHADTTETTSTTTVAGTTTTTVAGTTSTTTIGISSLACRITAIRAAETKNKQYFDFSNNFSPMPSNFPMQKSGTCVFEPKNVFQIDMDGLAGIANSRIEFGNCAHNGVLSSDAGLPDTRTGDINVKGGCTGLDILVDGVVCATITPTPTTSNPNPCLP
jgi:hypothetical protein